MTGKQQNDQPETDKIGKSMMIIAWIIAIGLGTWYFGILEDRHLNPNQSPTTINNQNSIRVELIANKYGHYVTTGLVDNKEVVFMLDTGATLVAIPGALEEYLNLQRGQSYLVNTANGRAKVYATRIDRLEIGGIVLDNVQAAISPTMQGEDILLGMSALKRLEFRQKGNKLTLVQQKY